MLENLKLDAPSASNSKSARMGSLVRKFTTYDVWSVGNEPNDFVGAEELKNISVMVPRKKSRGKLFQGMSPVIP